VRPPTDSPKIRHRGAAPEAGAPDEEHEEEIYTPVMFPHLFKSDADWEYYTEPQAELERPTALPATRENTGWEQFYKRPDIQPGNRWDFDNWAALGNEGWSSEELLELFKQSEEFRGTGDDEFHGTDGPLTVSDLVDPHPSSEMFIEAAESCGLDRNQDINGETQLGAGLYHVTQRDGKRCSSAAAYIKPVLDRENLTVQTRAHVTEIRFDGDRAVGVTYEQDGVEHTPDVTGEIVLGRGVQLPATADAFRCRPRRPPRRTRYRRPR